MVNESWDAPDYYFRVNLNSKIKNFLTRNTSHHERSISGGDPLILSDDKIEYILNRLSSIPHVEFVRIGSRVPIFLPQRLTNKLLKIFS